MTVLPFVLAFATLAVLLVIAAYVLDRIRDDDDDERRPE